MSTVENCVHRAEENSVNIWLSDVGVLLLSIYIKRHGRELGVRG